MFGVHFLNQQRGLCPPRWPLGEQDISEFDYYLQCIGDHCVISLVAADTILAYGSPSRCYTTLMQFYCRPIFLPLRQILSHAGLTPRNCLVSRLEPRCNSHALRRGSHASRASTISAPLCGVLRGWRIWAEDSECVSLVLSAFVPLLHKACLRRT